MLRMLIPMPSPHSLHSRASPRSLSRPSCCPSPASSTSHPTHSCTQCPRPTSTGESANGSFPDVAVSTMARIARSAEIGVNFYQSFDYIRTFTPKPVGPVEAICSAVAKNAVDIRPGALARLCFTSSQRPIERIPRSPRLLVRSTAYPATVHSVCLLLPAARA